MIGAPRFSTPSQSHPIGAPAPTRKWRWLRIIPLAVAVGSLITGLWVGLARLGVAVPSGADTLAEFHGALMISGFLGTLISLERSVAIGRWWAYTAPALSATGRGCSHCRKTNLRRLRFFVCRRRPDIQFKRRRRTTTGAVHFHIGGRSRVLGGWNAFVDQWRKCSECHRMVDRISHSYHCRRTA